MHKKCKIAGAVVAIGVAAITFGITLLLGFEQSVAFAIAIGIWIGFAVCGLMMRCKKKACLTNNDPSQAEESNKEIVSLFIGNLPFKTRESELREIFGEIGTVHSIKIPRDRKSGRARGFGFVEMNKEEALKAIEALNGKELNGRNLRINEANDHVDEAKETNDNV
ncbi:MAG: RNA-binding protein [Mariprofundaceae bacterium]|nr:RNA-binding protein [Mariprofundaceae bacterium]